MLLLFYHSGFVKKNLNIVLFIFIRFKKKQYLQIFTNANLTHCIIVPCMSVSVDVDFFTVLETDENYFKFVKVKKIIHIQYLHASVFLSIHQN